MNFFFGLGLFSDKYWSENCGSVEKKRVGETNGY